MTHHKILRDPAFECEVRHDRPYDERSPGHLVARNGSLIGSLDRGFMGAAARELLRQLGLRGGDR